MSHNELTEETEYLAESSTTCPGEDDVLNRSIVEENSTLLSKNIDKHSNGKLTERAEESNNCFRNEEYNENCEKTLQSKMEKNLYPNVLISPSRDHSDIDTDEEDFQMRKMTNHKRNDSGQGSSITDASLNTIQNDLKRLDLTDEEIQGVESDENSCNNLTDSPRALMPCQNPNGRATNNFLDNDDSDILSNIEDGTESALPKARFSASGKSTRLCPDSAASASFDEKDFTDIPLDSPGNKQNMNTYAPRPGLQGGSATSDSTDDLRKPSVTDTKTQSGFRLFRKDSSKSWKIFGNHPIKVPTSPQNQAPSKSKPSAKKPVMATSTTALILENRPANLPPKSAREEQRHKQLYEEMLKGAKKKEESDLHKELKKTKQQKQQEKGIVAIQRIWKEDVIPNWDAVKNTKKVKDLWWNGLPSSVRGKVWMLAIGNDLHITPELFQILQAHAVDKLAHQKSQEPVATLHDSESSLVVSKENTVGLISLDVARTFPALCIFQKGGPYHDSLKNLLGAYTCYRPDVGYVQGMSFIAAMLLLNMDTVDAFICFSNLMHKPCQMAFFMVNQPMMEAYFSTFDVMLEECAPRIHSHFQREKLSHDIYLIDWIFTLYSKSLPLDIASRVWDLFCRDGEDFLFRTALGILTLFQETLCNLDFFHLAQYLTKMSGEIHSDSLFQAIAALNFNRQKFQQVLAFYRNQNSLGNTR